MDIFNLWVHKDDPTKVYTFGNDYEILSKKDGLCFECYPLKEITGKVPDDYAYCVYDGVVLDDALYQFRVAIYDSKYIETYDSSKHEKTFSQEFFGPQADDKDPHINFSPIIHLIPGLTWSDFEKGNKASRFFRITDSGIWNYFAEGKEDFKKSLECIISNWKKCYYKLYIGQEFADLNARLTRESYLYVPIDINEDNHEDEDHTINEEKTIASKGHAADVSPFLFHSEQKLKEKREKEEAKLNKEYKWRVLLVDDRIDTIYLQPDDCKVSKDMIIKDRIEHLFGEGTCECVFLKEDKIDNVFDSIQDNNKTKVVILCVNTIDKAILALKNYKFDFILLDYLLDRNDPSNKAEKRHYGYEILKDLDDIINKDCSDLSSYLHYTDGKQYIVGPSHRYFFMFISAFTTAISERLRLEGFSRSEELWHIAEGACPTNTPELFCYNLQKMMIKRLKDSGIENLSPNKILDTVSYIYCREGGDDSIRKRANEKYQNILSLLYHYNRILEDVEIPTDGKNSWATQGSVLMTKYFINNLKEYGGLLEHLTHLVHLTAFGTARQWPEMWEEYLFFKNQFDSVCEDTDARKELFRAMEKYIIDLKKIN